MTQAIITKYISPTATKGARVKANCEAGSVTVAWNHSMTVNENHIWVLSRLVRKLGWGSEKRITPLDGSAIEWSPCGATEIVAFDRTNSARGARRDETNDIQYPGDEAG
jgi:hypothetical protein